MTRFRYVLFAYVILLAVMFILPFFSAEGYSMLRHTTSQLGAQNTPFAWVMNTTFVLMGAACVLDGWRHLGHYWFQKILLTIFGLGLILTGIFSHAPITAGVPYSLAEDGYHSLFASVVGFSFTILAFSAVFIEDTNRSRVAALAIGIAATLLSMLIFNVSSYAGVWQRLMFITSFAWLLIFLKNRLK